MLLARMRLASALVLIVALLCVGCSAAPSGPAALSLSAAGAGAAPSEQGDVLNALKAAREDLKIIDEMIADPDLGLLEEDTDDTYEPTSDDIAFYLGVLNDYNTKITGALEAIRGRTALTNQDMVYFTASEVAQFELSRDVLDEYAQVLHYYDALLTLGDQMDSLANVDATDPASMYKQINDSLTKAVDDLKHSNVPSFLQSMNDNMIASLNEMNDAVLYSLVAEDIDDPVRRDAAEYRMGILERKFTKLSSDADKDTEDRMAKLKSDIQQIQQVNEGLEKWVQTNIKKLGGS